jgi:methylmalonyl-CoA/ethylmalonyl-CoA epimerase
MVLAGTPETIDPGAKLHHIAYVVASIPEAAERLMRSQNATWDERIIHVPEQTVWISFLRPAVPDEPLVELVQPVDANSRVAAFLRRGGGFHHLCYEVEDVRAEVGYAGSVGSIILQKATQAKFFDGRSVAWACTRDRRLLEFLERRK